MCGRIRIMSDVTNQKPNNQERKAIKITNNTLKKKRKQNKTKILKPICSAFSSLVGLK
jgi:hypothetical protein